MQMSDINQLHGNIHMLNDVREKKRKFMLQEFWSKISTELANRELPNTTPGEGLSMEEILVLMSQENDRGTDKGAVAATDNAKKIGGDTIAGAGAEAALTIKPEKSSTSTQEGNDTSNVELDAAILMSKAAEMFILELTMNAWQASSVYSTTADGKGNSLKKSDIQKAIATVDNYDILSLL